MRKGPGIVLEDPRDNVGHAGAHLVLDHLVCPFDKEGDELLVAFGVPGDVQDILDDLPAVVEPEPELLVVEREGDILAGLFRVLVADERKEECPFGCFAAVADTGNGREVADDGLDLGVDQPGDFRAEHPCSDPEVPADMVRVDMGPEVLVDRCIRVVVVDDDEGDIVDACNLVGRLVLFGRPVIGEDDERHLLPEPDVVL